jgi:hypothetical protein
MFFEYEYRCPRRFVVSQLFATVVVDLRSAPLEVLISYETPLTYSFH